MYSFLRTTRLTYLSFFCFALFAITTFTHCGPGSSQNDAGPSGSCESNDDCKSRERCFRNKCKPKVSNVAPTAEINPISKANVNDTIKLDGSGSFDPEGGTLSYKWSFKSKPEESKAALQSAETARASFKVDKPGNYVVQLIVNDGKLDSAPATVTVIVEKGENQPPTAKIAPEKDTAVTVGSKVELDGTGSTDPNGDKLTYQWKLTPPATSQAKLSDEKADKPSFTADIEGDYVVELIVNDGTVDSDPVQVTVTAGKNVDVTPEITKLAPNRGAVGTEPTIKIEGKNFVANATVLFGGREYNTTFQSDTLLEVKLSLAGQSVGKQNLEVKNPNQKKSKPVEFELFEAKKPVITSLSPASAGRGSRFVMTIEGTDFVAGAKVFFTGTELTTRYKSDTKLEADVDLSSLGVSNGTYPISVRNTGGKTSDPKDFTVTDPPPPPVIKIVNPESAKSGIKTPLTIFGSLFTKSSQILFNNKVIPTTYVSTGEVKANPSLDLTKVKPGTYKLQVQNPGGSASGAFAFEVLNPFPAPKITSAAPSFAYTQSVAKITLNGTGFDAKGKAFFNSKPVKKYTFVSATAVQIEVDLTSTPPGSYMIYVENPPNPADPNKTPLKSNNWNYKVNPLPPANITSLKASGLYSLRPGKIVVTGSGFNNNTTIQVSTVGTRSTSSTYCNRLTTFTDRPTTYISPTQLSTSFTMPRTTSYTNAYHAVRVVRKGSSPSRNLCFYIAYSGTPRAPILTSITPTAIIQGTATASITLSGSYLYNYSRVYFNKKEIPYTYSSSSRLIIRPAVASLAVGSYDIYVENNSGDKSSVQKFSILKKGQPIITSLSPSSVYAGIKTSMTIYGQGFDAKATVLANGKVIGGKISTQSTTRITLTDLTFTRAQKGAVSIQVLNPGTKLKSNPVSFTVLTYPPPVLTSVSPTTVEEGSNTRIYLRGSSFRSPAKIILGKNPGQPCYSTGSSYAYCNTNFAGFPQGTVSVRIQNADGEISVASKTITIKAPSPPTISSLSPSTGYNNQVMTLTVNGSRFQNSSRLIFGNKLLPVTFVSNTRVTAKVDLTSFPQGFVIVKYRNITGGKTYDSNGINFTVLDPPKPTINYFQPMFGNLGQKVSVNIYGTNFTSNTKVKFKGKDQKITYTSSTRITAEIDLTGLTVGDYTIQLESSPKQKSVPVSFLVRTPPLPRLDYIRPAGVYPSNSSQTITLYGLNFDPKSKITVNNSAVAASSISSSQIRLALPFPAALFPAGGKYAVKVTDSQNRSVSRDIYVVSTSNPVASYVSPGSATSGSTISNLYIYGSGLSGSRYIYVDGKRYSVYRAYSSYAYARSVPINSTKKFVEVKVDRSGRQSNPAPLQIRSSNAPRISYLQAPAFKRGSNYALTIRGNYFVNNANGKDLKVLFGTQSLKAVSANSSTITVTLPLGSAPAGPQVIQIENPDGQRSEKVLFNVLP